MLRHGIHTSVPRQNKRAAYGNFSEQFGDKGRNQLHSPDNSACEGFFGRLKMEMFYGYSWSGVSINQFIEELNKYIKWYAEKRIKISLGGMSPLDYRKSLGLVV